MRTARRIALSYLSAATLALLAAASLGAAPAQQVGAGQTQGHPPRFRVVRSMCGSKATSHGTEYQIQDPRTTFHVPDDHQIIV